MKAKSPNTPPYQGVLKEPIGLPPVGCNESDDRQQLTRFLIEEYPYAYAERVEALFQHYNIPREANDAWLRLALRLAQCHVPGFQEASITKRGAKKGQNAGHAIPPRTIYRLVENYKKGKAQRISTRQALCNLRAHGPHKDLLKRLRLKTLQNLYTEGREASFARRRSLFEINEWALVALHQRRVGAIARMLAVPKIQFGGKPKHRQRDLGPSILSSDD